MNIINVKRQRQRNDSILQSTMTFYPIEINGQKYLICKLPDQPFSTLHDPATKQIVGQWNNEIAQYEIFPTAAERAADILFERQMKELISSGAFIFI